MWSRSSFFIIALAGTMGVAPSGGPPPPALAGWATYVEAVERRVAGELHDDRRFLALDFLPNATADRQAIQSGNLVVRRARAVDATGNAIGVPSALVHHWVGAVLIPRTQFDDLLRSLQDDVPDTGQEDVLESRVLDRTADGMTVFLKLRRTRFITVVYNTEHVVRFSRRGAARAASSSTATKIAEVASPGTATEHELPAGEDSGFLWRWNAYWRYEQVPAGVIVECESVSLSRSMPFGLRSLLSPLVESTARDSMTRTLTSMRAHFQKAAVALGGAGGRRFDDREGDERGHR